MGLSERYDAILSWNWNWNCLFFYKKSEKLLEKRRIVITHMLWKLARQLHYRPAVEFSGISEDSVKGESNNCLMQIECMHEQEL